MITLKTHHMLKFLIGLIFLVFLEAPTEAKTNFTKLESRTLTLINEYRASKNLAALQTDEELHHLASQHSEKMASGKMPFGHRGFKERARQITRGRPGIRVAENVAKNNHPAEETAQRALESWLRSPGHRKNILGTFTRTGIAIRKSESGHFYFTQLFAQ